MPGQIQGTPVAIMTLHRAQQLTVVTLGASGLHNLTPQSGPFQIDAFQNNAFQV
jgi:hypothetical protein